MPQTRDVDDVPVQSFCLYFSQDVQNVQFVFLFLPHLPGGGGVANYLILAPTSVPGVL